MRRCEAWADETLEMIREKMSWVSEKNRDKIPYQTDGKGDYDDRSDETKTWNIDDGLNWWTNGFWGGMMWMLYQDTGDEKYAEIARISEVRLEQCFQDYYGLHHDVGFMFMPTAVADYRLTGNPDSRRRALHAASLLAGRFNPAGQFIRAWNDEDYLYGHGETTGADADDGSATAEEKRGTVLDDGSATAEEKRGTVPADSTKGWAIIDCMFNISLLYWASEETKDPRFRQIAMMHTDTVMKNFIRPDGSVCHIVEFDPETGRMVRSLGGQGYAEGSAWTRGQGWAVYGFMISYLHTGKREYLETARKVADYCLANIPENGIIPVDFRQPPEPAYEDSCGACIIAGGFLELAKCLQEPERTVYEDGAVKILKAIADTRADFGTGCDAIVKNCSAAYHSSPHHVTMSYADYYFIEAMYKIKGTGKFMW